MIFLFIVAIFFWLTIGATLIKKYDFDDEYVLFYILVHSFISSLLLNIFL